MEGIKYSENRQKISKKDRVNAYKRPVSVAPFRLNWYAYNVTNQALHLTGYISMFRYQLSNVVFEPAL